MIVSTQRPHTRKGLTKEGKRDNRLLRYSLAMDISLNPWAGKF